MRVADYGLDERPTERINGERAGDMERLTGRDIRINFGVGDVGEGDLGVGHDTDSAVVLAPSMIDEPVARIQDARPAALTQPPLAGDLGEVGLPVNDSVDDKCGIAAEDESVQRRSVRVSNGFGFRARQQFDHRSRFEVTRRRDDRILVDTGGNGQRFDTRRTKSRKASG